jgi:hypothetical protein
VKVLKLGQVVHDFRLAPIDGADKFAPQNALAINDVGLRKLECPVKIIALLGRIANRQQVHFVFLEKVPICALVGVDANGQDFDAFIFHFLLHLDQRRHLIHARRAPGGPEIEDHDLAAKLIEADFAVVILNGEFGGRGPDPGRSTASVTARQGQDEDGEGYNPGQNRSASHKVIIADSVYGKARDSIEQANRVGDRSGAE